VFHCLFNLFGDDSVACKRILNEVQGSQQHAIDVVYRGAVVGVYTADMLIEGALIVEIKAVKALDGIHTIADLIRELREIGATWPDELDLRLLPRHCCSAYLWEIIPKAK